MDSGITNIFIFYLRSWLILSIVISQPSCDHRFTLAIYLTASVWINQYKRNREFGSIHSYKVPRYVPRFQELNKDLILLHPFQESHHSVLYPTNTHSVFFLNKHTHTNTHTHSLSLSLSLSHTHTHTQTHAHTHTHTHTRTHAHTHTHARTHTHLFTHKNTHTHTHAHKHTHTQTHTHTYNYVYKKRFTRAHWYILMTVAHLNFLFVCVLERAPSIHYWSSRTCRASWQRKARSSWMQRLQLWISRLSYFPRRISLQDSQKHISQHYITRLRTHSY